MNLLIIYIIMGIAVMSNIYLYADVSKYSKIGITIATILYFIFWPLFYCYALCHVLKTQGPYERLFTCLRAYCILYVLIQGIIAMI